MSRTKMKASEVKIMLSICDFNEQNFSIEISVANFDVQNLTFSQLKDQFSSWEISFRDEIVLTKLSKLTQLIFLAQGKSEGRVCFAESMELRPDFRNYFTQQDLKYYILGTLVKNDIEEDSNSKSFGSQTSVSYPTNADEFWKYRAEGEKIAVQ